MKIPLFIAFYIYLSNDTKNNKIFGPGEAVQRRAPSVPNIPVTRFERVSDVRLAYLEFCNFFNTPGARVSFIRCVTAILLALQMPLIC